MPRLVRTYVRTYVGFNRTHRKNGLIMTKTATLKTINTSAFDATGRPGRVRLARTIRIYTRRLEHIGAPAHTYMSRPQAVHARAHIGQFSPLCQRIQMRIRPSIPILYEHRSIL